MTSAAWIKTCVLQGGGKVEVYPKSVVLTNTKSKSGVFKILIFFKINLDKELLVCFFHPPVMRLIGNVAEKIYNLRAVCNVVVCT